MPTPRAPSFGRLIVTLGRATLSGVHPEHKIPENAIASAIFSRFIKLEKTSDDPTCYPETWLPIERRSRPRGRLHMTSWRLKRDEFSSPDCAVCLSQETYLWCPNPENCVQAVSYNAPEYTLTGVELFFSIAPWHFSLDCRD